MPASDPKLTDFPVSPLAQRLFALAADAGHDIRIVGGAVRDWQAGFEIGDIDMAVAAPIESFAAICRDAGLRVIDTGLSHGTVTIVADGETIEVTQTRVDLETDGRHARVGFSDDWVADANRRDFTINAIYLDADGQIDDPLGGLADLQSGVLRFAGDAAQRVAEDALRMLRFCRFLPRFGGGRPDMAALAAITDASSAAAVLSGERVAAECRKLFGMPDAALGITVLHSTGLDLGVLGQTLDPARLDQLVGDALATDQATLSWADTPAAWLVRLAVVMPAGSSRQLADRMRLSREERRCLEALDLADPDGICRSLADEGWRKASYHIRKEGMSPAALLAVAAARAGHQVTSSHLAELHRWQPPVFPLTGADLLSHGVDKGPALGEMLRGLERHWLAQDFAPGREELMEMIGLVGLDQGQI